MFYFIGIVILVQCVSADIILNLNEGSPCEHEGVQGTCRRAYECPSYYIQRRYQPKGCWPLKCPPKPEVTICYYSDFNFELVVCCTDCYIDDSSKAVVTHEGVVWKTGVRKSYDKCAEYAADLPYPWKDGKEITFKKVYDTETKCHNLEVVVKKEKVKGKQQPRRVRVDFPHYALLGEHYTGSSQFNWGCLASVISNRFLITSAYCTRYYEIYSDIDAAYVVMGIDKYPDSGQTLLLSRWQQHKVKQLISHPKYEHPSFYYNIGLIKTVNEIEFGINVLPICLSDQPLIHKTVEVDVLVLGEEGVNNTKGNIQKSGEKECTAYLDTLSWSDKSIFFPRGIDFDTQMCYEGFNEEGYTCEMQGKRGRPIFVNGSLLGMKYAVGISSLNPCSNTTYVYTRIDKVLSWIEDIVWP